MHLSTLLTLAVTSSVAVLPASARLDRRSASHRDIARAVHSKRTPTPEPFRVFNSDGQPAAAAPVFEGLALHKRDSASDVLGKIGDVVNEVAVAWKLALPTQNAEPVALAAASAKQEEQEKAAQEKAAAEKAAADKAAAEKAAAEKKAAEEAAAKKKAAQKLAAKKKALAAERTRKAAERAAAKEAAEEAAAKKKAAAEAKAAEEKAAAEAAAKKAAEQKAAADKAAAEKAAADKAAAEKAAAEKKAQEEAAAQQAAQEKKAAEAAAAKKAAAEKKAAEEKAAAAAEKKEAEQKKVYDSSKESKTKLAVFNPGNSRSLLGYSASNCGPSGANAEYPNGSLDWLNCGISKSNPSSGWTPPDGVTLDRITTVSLEHALATNHVWEPCRDLVWLFDKVAAETGLPAILLASFALQESTCNPKTIGGGGEVGLMQITPDKCGGRSTAACLDPEFNLRTAATYFKQELANQGGQFLKALGAYNGWYSGLSYNGATAAANSGCCRCQNNLDYLFQMTNGWLVGKTGYELKSYNNLAVCG